MSIDGAMARVTGEESRDQIGNAIAPAGDTNGDGVTDLLIDARFSDLGGDDAGAAYVLLSPYGTGDMGVESAPSVLVGESPGDQLGSTLVAGDLNGDGFSDVIVTSVNSAASGVAGGAAYFVHGPVPSGALVVSDADTRIAGTTLAMYLGYSATMVTDQDGDGWPDVALGAPLYGAGNGLTAIVSGASLGDAELIEVTLSSTAGTPSTEGLGASLLGADMDGDGISEMAIGAPEAIAGSGDRTGTVFGMGLPLSASIEDADWTITGPEADAYFGVAVVSAGDIDGDGRQDLIVGATGVDTTAEDAGAAYLFLAPLEEVMTASDADAIYLGLDAGDELGQAITGPGDLDGDGVADIALGTPTHSPPSTLSAEAGLVMIFSGDARGVIDGETGAEAWIIGESSGDGAGSSLATIGDVDSDGIDDLMVGAPSQDTAGPNAGAAYLLSGGGI